MKKWLLVLVLAGGLFHLYGDRLPKLDILAWFQGGAGHGQLDESGRSLIQVYRIDDCRGCDSIVKMLSVRGVSYQEFSLDDGDEVQSQYRKFGGKGIIPYLVAADRVLTFRDEMELVSALAELYGDAVLKRNEQLAMSNHFDSDGRPRVYMYATSWCGYCRAARQYFAQNNIEYEEINPETSGPGRLRYQILQGRGYPLIYIGYRRFTGFPNPDLDKALAGFQGGSV